jgi:galactonate dehydratase
MKITGIETIRVPEHEHLIWVQIHTDEGITGLGETFMRVEAAENIIHSTYAGMLIGRNPLDIEGLWHEVFQAINYHGYAGAEMRAYSAIDIALWDILGKYYNAPLYRLLGGKTRESTDIYNTCVSYGPVRDRELFLENPGELAKSLLKDGIKTMKIWPFDNLSVRTKGQSISQADLAKGVWAFEKIREAVGNDIEIALEGHSCWNLPSAIKIAKALEPYNVAWLEDMIPVDNIKAVKQLKDSTSTPLLVSERLFSRYQYTPILEAGAADIISTDICWSGGISEFKKIAALASAYQLPVVPHNCGGPIQTTVYSHVCNSTENIMMIETVRAFYNAFYDKIITKVPRIEGNQLFVHDAPGIGTELNPALLERKDIHRRVSTATSTENIGWTSGDPWEGVTERF